MRYLAFYGASDDLIEVEGAVRDEFNVYRPTTLSIVAEAPTGSIRRAEVTGKFWDAWEFEYLVEDPWEIVEFGGSALLFILKEDEVVEVEQVD